MQAKEPICLINQRACGREFGNPICPKCGMDERVVYPGQADREAAQAQALRFFKTQSGIDPSECQKIYTPRAKEENQSIKLPGSNEKGAVNKNTGNPLFISVYWGCSLGLILLSVSLYLWAVTGALGEKAVLILSLVYFCFGVSSYFCGRARGPRCLNFLAISGVLLSAYLFLSFMSIQRNTSDWVAFMWVLFLIFFFSVYPFVIVPLRLRRKVIGNE